MIQILEGPSGSGKSYQLYTRMIEQAVKEPERRFFLIVPEQSTMQAQRDVVTMHPRRGTMNIDIVSFNRLAYRVFEEQNVNCDHVLEDFGKSMLIKRILMEHRKELPVFGPNASRDGFVDELKSLLTELFQYRITEDRLEEVLKKREQETGGGAVLLCQKLRELLFVYRQFQKEIQGKYIIAEHILEMLAMHVPQSDLLAGSVLFLDGYTGFTPIQYDLLQALAAKVSSMTFTVTIDQTAAEKASLAEHELFYLSKDTINRIRRLGERLDLYVEEEYLEGGAPRFRNAPELNFLEQNLFRYPYRVWKGQADDQGSSGQHSSVPDGIQEHEAISNAGNSMGGRQDSQIHILAMKDTRQELQVVARQIHAMVREGRYRYRDIAIMHGDLNELAPIAEEVLPQLAIPYFIDMNQNMYMNPCLESIRALLMIAEQDYSYDSVFRFLKTGILDRYMTEGAYCVPAEVDQGQGRQADDDQENRNPINDSRSDDNQPDRMDQMDQMNQMDQPDRMDQVNQMEALENYCRKKGIRGLAYWKRMFSEERQRQYPEGLEESHILPYGRKVLAFLQMNTDPLKSAETVREYTNVLQEYLTQVRMQELLEQYVAHFEEEENYVQARAYSQIYDKLLDILEKLTVILGDARIGIEEFRTLLDTGLDDIALGVIPPSLDQLVIGDVERTRLNHVKVLYVMGVNDGIIPKVSRGAGILSEADRSLLSKELELAPDSRQQVFTEQFYLYQNITKPSDELYLTYHVQSGDGNELLPAYLISRIRKLFPDMTVETPDLRRITWDQIETEQDSRGLLAARLHEEGANELEEAEGSIWKGLYLYYQREAPEILQALQEGASYNNISSMLTPQTAARLYGEFLNTSVSKLETYSKCPYQFFLQYGMNLRKREQQEVSLSDMGTLLHGVVEQVFRRVETRHAEDHLLTEEKTENPWEKITEEELTRLTMEAVDRIADSEQGAVYKQTNANRNLLNRMRQVAAYAVVDLKSQLMKGSMIPYRFELEFNRRNSDRECKNLASATIPLEQGNSMTLSGIIDRIDVCQDESHVYVKVLDYKSSQKELEMTQITAGLQLQLLIYTNVVMEILKKRFPEKEIIPAGSLYYGFKIPMVEKKVKEETTIRNVVKATAMTGIVNEDENCRSYMGDPDILPGPDEELGKYSDLLEEVQDTVKNLGEDILGGKIPIRPVKAGRGLPCDYCDYRDVCKLDVKDGGNRVITAKQLMKDRKMEQTAAGNKGQEHGTNGSRK